MCGCNGICAELMFEFGVAELLTCAIPWGFGETDGMLNGLMSSLKELPTLLLFWSCTLGCPGAI